MDKTNTLAYRKKVWKDLIETKCKPLIVSHIISKDIKNSDTLLIGIDGVGPYYTSNFPKDKLVNEKELIKIIRQIIPYKYSIELFFRVGTGAKDEHLRAKR